MRSCPLIVALALGMALLPASASAAGAFDGTYSGTSDEGQQISLQIAGGEMKSISGAAIRKLTCFREDRTQQFPNDSVQQPDKNGEFAIDKTRRSSLKNSQFLVGTENKQTGNRIVNSAEGRFSTQDGKPVITMTLFYEEVTEFEGDQNGQPVKQTRCSGGADATLNRTSAAPTGLKVKLRAPKNMPGSLKASVPALASLGDDGIGIAATTTKKAKGGKIAVSIRRDRSAADKLGFGSGVLGKGSKKVSRSGRTSFRIDMKRPRKTPSQGDSVPMLVTVTFTTKAGKAKRAVTKIAVKG